MSDLPEIDFDMAASSRPRDGTLAARLATLDPETLLPYRMHEVGPFEMPDYRDLPPGAKVLTASMGDMLYAPANDYAPEREPVWPVVLLIAAFAVGLLAGYFGGRLL